MQVAMRGGAMTANVATASFERRVRRGAAPRARVAPFARARCGDPPLAASSPNPHPRPAVRASFARLDATPSFARVAAPAEIRLGAWLPRGRRVLATRGARVAARASSSSSDDERPGARNAPDADSATEANPAESAAAADDDSDGNDAAEEVVGVEVPPPGAAPAPGTPPSPPSSRLREDDEKKDVGRPVGFVAWFRAVFQPLRLFAIAVNTFLFFFAASIFNQNTTNATGATHLVPASYSRFLAAVKSDDVASLVVDGQYLTWKPKTPFVIKRQGASMMEEKIEVAYSAARPEDARVPYDTLLKNRVDFAAVDKRSQSQRNFNTFLSVMIIFLAMLQFNRIGSQPSRDRNSNMGGLNGGFMRGMGSGPNTSAGRMTGGRERGALAPPSTTFSDVAGVDEAKEELQEIVDILKRPEHYTRLGARPPSGVLLVGAPGTGKTLLARAVAGEAGVPFISVSASEFVELYVGMGAARVRDVFARAREQAPAIVFIDEIDAVAKGRSEGRMRGMGNDEREQTLNQLLTELDGFDGDSLVICLAATNRADTLDAALKRPGRFDRTVSVERPDKQGRKEILGVHIGSRNLPLAPGFDADDIASMTAGFTGAELANLVNEAALLAGRKGMTEVGEKEFEDAVLRTVAGIEKKRSLLTAAEKTVVSAHEAGHAVVGTAVGALIPGQQRPEQLSIVARSGGALGFTYIPPGEEDRKLMFADELRGRLVTLMGGRAAEIVACARVSTGALDDIQRATDLAYKAVAEYGLSPTVGPVSVPTLSAGGGEDSLFGGGVAEDANRQVEREVKETLVGALWVAVGLVEKNRRVLDDISDELSEQEKVMGDGLQRSLDRVVATDDLERFLRGDDVSPPEGSALWNNLPLPAFPTKEKTDGDGAAGPR
jgi:cell division protease FtsH